MSMQQVLGLPVDCPDDMTQPLEIAMVVKGLDDEGKFLIGPLKHRI